MWIAGPLSGLIVQPIVGAVSDESASRWGRRRPLILVCSVVVAAGLLVLGFTAEIVGWVVPDAQAARTPTVALAVLAIYVVDFAINAVMSCSRSLIVDTLSLEKQQAGASWGECLFFSSTLRAPPLPPNWRKVGGGFLRPTNRWNS